MLAIAELLIANGADVNEGHLAYPGSDHVLSALYGAIGHADNMALGHWLLENGVDPDDGESLYHATELAHHEGLRLLLKFGADPKGTNALLRAMDFDDVEALRTLLKAGAEADDFNGTHVGGERPWVIPALHQAARRMSSRAMIDELLDAIEVRGQATPLSPEEELLAAAADGEATEGFIDPAKLPEACRNIIRMILNLPGKLDHVKRLVALGVGFDRPDAEELTPVQAAGWEGLHEVMAYFLSLKPDLSHVNSYGGTLLSTIIHGSENCPQRADRDYIGCLELALEAGVALPRGVHELAGDQEVAAFLFDWTEARPGQVVEGGVA